jgi:hypothetical protein
MKDKGCGATNPKCGAGHDEGVKYMKAKDETRHTVVPAQVTVACPH